MKKLSLGEKLKEIRLDNNLTMEELANLLNTMHNLNINKSMISRWENDKATPVNTFLSAYAKQFKIDLNYLLDVPTNNITNLEKYDIKKVKLKQVPLLGEIACGKPILAVEDRDSFIMVEEDIPADFCLRCKGDSMINADILDGDIVYIKKQPIVNNGEIAVIIIDDEATLKRFYYHKEFNLVELRAENENYQPLLYKDEQLEQINFLGKVIGVYKKI